MRNRTYGCACEQVHHTMKKACALWAQAWKGSQHGVSALLLFYMMGLREAGILKIHI
jgi:hypothetical protein